MNLEHWVTHAQANVRYARDFALRRADEDGDAQEAARLLSEALRLVEDAEELARDMARKEG